MATMNQGKANSMPRITARTIAGLRKLDHEAFDTLNAVTRNIAISFFRRRKAIDNEYDKANIIAQSGERIADYLIDQEWKMTPDELTKEVRRAVDCFAQRVVRAAKRRRTGSARVYIDGYEVSPDVEAMRKESLVIFFRLMDEAWVHLASRARIRHADARKVLARLRRVGDVNELELSHRERLAVHALRRALIDRCVHHAEQLGRVVGDDLRVLIDTLQHDVHHPRDFLGAVEKLRALEESIRERRTD